eukprot:403353122
MLSVETEARIANIFVVIAQFERKLETKKQVLVELEDFEPITCFQRFDRLKRGKIDANDIQDFLDSNSLMVSEQEAHKIIKLYDKNNDGCLHLEEFLEMILPNHNNKSRSIAANREQYFVSHDTKLDFKIEHQLATIFQFENSQIKTIEHLKDELSSRHDFNVVDAFITLQREGPNKNIHYKHIQQFVNRNGGSLNEQDLLNILRKYQSIQDLHLTFEDFQKLILPFGYESKLIRSGMSSPIKHSERVHQTNQSPLRQKGSNFYTPLKQKSLMSNQKLRSSETRAGTSIKNSEQSKKLQFDPKDSLYHERLNNNQSTYTSSFKATRFDSNFESPSRKEDAPLSYNEDPYFFSFSRQSPQKLRQQDALQDPSVENNLSSAYKRRVVRNKEEDYKFKMPIKQSRFMMPYEEDEIARAFKELIVIDKDLESQKCLLALKSDFNLEDAYKIFDVESKGNFNIREFQEGLNIMRNYPQKEEIQLLLQKFDSDQDGKLSFNEFSNMILPMDKNYASLIISRSSYHHGQNYSRGECFIPETQRELLNVLNQLLQNEIRAEKLRNNLKQRENFDLTESFNALDEGKRGFIDQTQIRRFLEDRHYFPTNKDLKLLMKRIDINQDNLISLSEYIQEFTLKLI